MNAQLPQIEKSQVDAFYQTNAAQTHKGRPYLGVLFDCCGVYARVYRKPDQKAYTARCPRCLRAARVRVGPEGKSTRFLLAE